jgi:hypothetical protein
MSGLLFLNADDFNVQTGTKGKIMCIPIPGFSLVLFYSTQCKHCKQLVPIFKRLPGSISGCQFGMLNVGTNMKVAAKSKGTITEIKYVPLILLYINGKPFMRYAGKYDRDEIIKFVVSMSKRVQNNQTFTKKQSGKPDPNIKEDPRGGIPAFSIGKPLKGDGRLDICYLEFQNAYKKTSSSKSKKKSFNDDRQLPAGAGMSANHNGMIRH